MGKIRSSDGELIDLSLLEHERRLRKNHLTGIEEWMGRAESNWTDLKNAIARNTQDIKELSEKVSQSLQLFHEALAGIHDLRVKSEKASQECLEQSLKWAKYEGNSNLIKVIISWAVGLAGACVAVWQIIVRHKG